MKNSPLISIVVPVYNVEQYLKQCIESIVRQTYKNIEIILVDDGSTDNSGVVCDEWSDRDCRIKVIHKANGGLSDARNAGMQIATGELIGFVDSDDYISENMYELLYNNMLENESDISACGVQMFWDKNTTQSRMLTPTGTYVFSNKNAIVSTIDEIILKQPVWYKLYKTDLIRDIFFPVGKYHEDVFWTYQAVARAEKISIFDTPCYFYRQRSESIMGNDFSLKRLDALEAKVMRSDFISKNFPEIADKANCDVWFSCMYLLQQSMLHLSKKDYIVAYKAITTIRKKHKNFRAKTVTRLKQRIWLVLSRVSFITTCKLRNLLKIGI